MTTWKPSAYRPLTSIATRYEPACEFAGFPRDRKYVLRRSSHDLLRLRL